MEVGEHCSLASCHQLDFLPVRCDRCGLPYCQAHALPAQHACTAPPAPPPAPGAPPARYPCSLAGCSRAEPAPVRCPACLALVCLGHRHQPDHACPKLEVPVRAMAATREVVQAILSAAPGPVARTPRSIKAQKTAARVQLMKLKMSSKAGDPGLPQAERVYLLVSPPRHLARPPVGCWVGSGWPVGRALDSLASSLGLDNRNNVPGAPRLLLCRGADGRSLCGDMSEPVGRLLEREELFNGDSVMLELEDGAGSPAAAP